jgi:hypothetical protein
MAELVNFAAARAHRQAGRCVCGCGIFRAHPNESYRCYDCGRFAPGDALLAPGAQSHLCACGLAHLTTAPQLAGWCPRCEPAPPYLRPVS